MLDMISVLNLLKLVLCPSIWSILENVPCALEKNVYSAALGWNVLFIYVCVCVCVYTPIHNARGRRKRKKQTMEEKKFF